MFIFKTINIYNTIHIFVICTPQVVPNPLSDPSPSSFQVYCHIHYLQQSPCESIQVLTIVSPLASTIESNLPIALCKGIRCTRNPSPHYISLSYHRLFSPFCTCLSSISFTITKNFNNALGYPKLR